MQQYQNLVDNFITQNQEILGDNLIGIYLHGSAVMGCFHAEKSDIDFLIVVKNEISDGIKRRYLDMVVTLNKQAPAKGIELSILKETVCSPFVYPTPFLLHFSIAHLTWYQENPDDYIHKMQGEDKDLAAHATVLLHRGKTLYGKEKEAVFTKVKEAYYWDSIWYDIENAEEEVTKQPMYMILNLCRALAFKREHLVLSKLEGGEWGLKVLSGKYSDLITGALEEYQGGKALCPDALHAKEYAGYMLAQIKGGEIINASHRPSL